MQDGLGLNWAKLEQAGQCQGANLPLFRAARRVAFKALPMPEWPCHALLPQRRELCL